MWKSGKRSAQVLGGVLIAGLFTSLLAAKTPVPGTVNYLEGQVSINGSQISPKSAGSAEVGENQSLSTDRGKAEVLLTPGVFLRVGDNSTFRMVSSGLTDTQVQLDRGEAIWKSTSCSKKTVFACWRTGVPPES